MKGEFGVLEKILSKDLIKNLSIREYHRGEFLLALDERKILYLLEGTVYAVRYHDGEKIIHPYFFKPNQFIGINMYLQKDIRDWEMVAATKKVRAVVLDEKFLEEHMFNDAKILRFILERGSGVIRQGARGFFMRSHGGAKVFFAFIIMSNSVDGKMHFLKYNDIAHVLNVGRSMLYKLTGELVHEGCIEKNKDCINILDEEKLKRYYEEYMY
ncbi:MULTISPECIES: Crp/Fnr family transcriptional regulator [Psychrilyobacter]|uniref:Crp/Fnr family transcriptional regulator n=1 Tax=Psychrilyobacter piezotolerans TaxID=2293438 RepID=A0ABX9KGQ4_9FUSO|nr:MULTISPECIES: Crp/Fnr family transcriptional regulator [Psychrilyobacter]MCS5422728.1 Crp/Fnr family transcriptional regulator [Psychrilyobacter sp. S5]NDI77978.1 Crp/Fnr family transcriptional regulator [Psychrilyobacter piezotolerans]RDE61922.1 Crp/Fnr family transcriptional regulator [Psychrilyobacter sp. S5]REI41148.1 Crp/Fnr family transcriptional regulator [Psychrilyobacter piezotolerans]